MLKIGDLSRLTRISVKTLRYYDEMELLKPEYIDPFTGYRYYSLDQLPRLNRILALKDLGLSLQEICLLLAENVTPAEMRGMLRMKRLEIQERLEQERERLARVDSRLRQIEQEDRMPTVEVVLKEVEPVRVAGLRARIPTFADQGALWDQLGAYLARHGLSPVGPCLTVYYDSEFRERDVDVEVCEPLAGSAPDQDPVQIHSLPGLRTAACILHHGGFEQVGATYDTLLRWIEANGYRPAGPNREVYLRAKLEQPSSVPYPEQYLTERDEDRITEIQFPVEKV
ncbi:MAG: MerR family transcriptional regulator [Rudaea sp.]